MAVSLKELEKMRREWVEVTRKNGFREGITDLLAHQYSKKTHFIFELLQNAEDAGASKVEFQVENERLIFSHNGDRLFSDENVESISSIGRSTKQTDYTQIGKHGIGFKAVFAYTHAPRIHSGEKHFEIEDVVVPRLLNDDEVPTDIRPGETRIVLPFDSEAIPENRRFRELVPASSALIDISEALQQLSIRTLLFLRNIEEIRWKLPSGTVGTYLRESCRTSDRADLRHVDLTDGHRTETWNVFERRTDIQEAGKNHQCIVEVAFLIQDGRLTQAQNTELVVYFPTEKATELGFLIQGPFKTTKARDNIAQDCEANQRLIEVAAELAAGSLENLRDLGLLNIESFKALPLKSSVFDDDGTRFFMPVYQAVHEALNNRRLLPKYRGDFVAASEARLARGAQLADLFSPEQLGMLFGVDQLYWLDIAITADRMPELRDYLAGKRKQWPRNEWEQEPLVEGIELEAKDLAPKLTASFLQGQDEAWLVRFYEYLDKNLEAYRFVPFVRLEDGRHVLSSQAFLPPRDPSGIDTAVFPLVMQSVADNQTAYEFLRDKAKLREPDAVDVVIKCLLPKYPLGTLRFDQAEYESDLQRIVAASLGEGRYRMTAALRSTKFIASTHAHSSESGEVAWRAVGDQNVFIRTTELEAWFATNDQDEAWFIHSAALRILNNRILDCEVALRTPVFGCNPTSCGKIRFESQHGWHKQGLDGFNPEAQILGLNFALHHWNQDRARYLWSVLLDIPQLIKGDIQQETNLSRLDAAPRKSTYSKLGRACVSSAWLPDKECVSRKPKDLLLSELPTGFETTSIRAKEVALRLGMKQPEKEQALDIITGGDPILKELIDLYQSGSDSDREKLKKMIPTVALPAPAPAFKDGLRGLSRSQRGETSQQSMNPIPVSNPGRYQKKLDDEVEKAVNEHQTSPHVVTFSPVRNQPSNSEARNFLYSEYQGRCQVTGHTFSKAYANQEGVAENYFEACALLSYSNADYLNDEGNMLCVSADTMAKFKNASFEWVDDLQEVIKRFTTREPGDMAIAHILLAGEKARITWSERHFMRLIALWNKA
ncbi:MAG: hypothetical protein Q8M11_06760 [Sulfuritalea sp.]|nr:hypothetical protein [Sulfuritalea sp.]MDP1982880.1 hypothetical protein [Sulfuritalea sp.]